MFHIPSPWPPGLSPSVPAQPPSQPIFRFFPRISKFHVREAWKSGQGYTIHENDELTASIDSIVFVIKIEITDCIQNARSFLYRDFNPGTILHNKTLMYHVYMAPHSSTLAWKIPWMEEPDRLQSMGSLRVRHDWETSFSLFTVLHWRRKWQPTPVFLPGESHGQRSLVGCSPWGR